MGCNFELRLLAVWWKRYQKTVSPQVSSALSPLPIPKSTNLCVFKDFKKNLPLEILLYCWIWTVSLAQSQIALSGMESYCNGNLLVNARKEIWHMDIGPMVFSCSSKSNFSILEQLYIFAPQATSYINFLKLEFYNSGVILLNCQDLCSAIMTASKLTWDPILHSRYMLRWFPPYTDRF